MIYLFLLIGIIIGYLIRLIQDNKRNYDALFIRDENGTWTLDMQRDVEALHNGENLKISVYLL